jgi:CrcB protein
MNAYLLVAIGGAVGSVARYWTTGIVTRLLGAGFPWGTLLINIVGSLVIGTVAAVPTGGLGLSDPVRLLIMTGVCGGFTTFSAFSLQTLELMEMGRHAVAFGYVLSSVVLCVIACWLGYLLGSSAST